MKIFYQNVNSISYILNNVISISNPEYRIQLDEIISIVILSNIIDFTMKKNLGKIYFWFYLVV